MAARRYRPGRTLIIFFLGIAVMYGLVALTGTWKPALGLDLQGGLRITLTAEGSPSKESLEEARRIIDQRVNGSGIVEAEVTTQSGKYIVVEIPGSTENRRATEDLVKKQAQLRFRLVACEEGAQDACATGSPLGRAPLSLAKDDKSGGKGGKNRDTAPSQTASPTDTASPTETTSPSDTTNPSDTATPDAGDAADDSGNTAEDALAWVQAPDQQSIALFNKLQCNADDKATDKDGKPIPLGVLYETDKSGQKVLAPQPDEPDQPLVACEVDGDAVRKYLLSRSVIEGTELTDAGAQIPSGQVKWVVTLDIGNDKDKAYPKGSTGGEDDFETISQALVQNGGKFAIVLDGQVLSAPVMESAIHDGSSQISGNFTEETAMNLATSLKYGALPIAFEKDVTTDDIGPSLAGDQLSAGLTAGGIGLALVMLYCLLYYRGLGLVVVSSLFVAASITYAAVLLLSEAAGFTLTLPGIAGLIIAIGITADSFVIYFERIRDEMRDGKSMRVAVETGWARARVTRMAANTVSILSATVLYIFATGAVKGFGFALGLSTLVDLAVLFWFTKPLVSWLAQFKAFNSGHKLSGLSPETLGMDQPKAPAKGKVRTAGGNA